MSVHITEEETDILVFENLVMCCFNMWRTSVEYQNYSITPVVKFLVSVHDKSKYFFFITAQQLTETV